MIHLVYSFAMDPVVQLARSESLKDRFRLISVRDLYAMFMETGSIPSLEHALVLDRCGDGWDAEGLLDIGAKDLNSLYGAYYCQLHRCKGTVARLYHLGTPWNPNRLPAQWALIQNHCLPIQVPEYFEGAEAVARASGDFVLSHPNNLYHWQGHSQVRDGSRLLFRRPPGDALIIAKAYDEYLYMKSNGEALDAHQISYLTRIKEQLEPVIPFQFGEILVFAQSTEHTFGMFSNYPMVAGKQAVYRELLHDKLAVLTERFS